MISRKLKIGLACAGIAAMGAAPGQPTSSLAQVVGGPRLVADLYATQANWSSSEPHGYLAVGPYVLFAATDPQRGCELWRTDGTPAGTEVVVELSPGPDDSALGYEDSAARFGAGAVFQGTEHLRGGETYFTDGTAAGTRLVRDIEPGPLGSRPESHREAGGFVYFVAHTEATGNEIWRSDGTAAGTELVADIVPGPSGSDPSDFVAVGAGDLVVFLATTEATSREPFVTDGTAAGTRLLADIRPGNLSSGAAELTASGGLVFFAANGPNGREPWVSDGTPGGTRELADLNPSGGSSPHGFIDWEGTVFFLATDTPGAGKSLWRSDGTPGGTTVVRAAEPAGTRWQADDRKVVFGDRLVFEAGDATTGWELWETDGTPAGTRLFVDVVPGPIGCSPGNLATDGTILWFAGGTVDEGRELWRTDGTVAGTFRLTDLRLGPANGLPSVISPDAGVLPGHLVFTGCTDETGCEPWVSDGTVGGTELLADIHPQLAESRPRDFIALEGRVAFTHARPGDRSDAPGISDGSAAGTLRIGDAVLGPGGGVSYLALAPPGLLLGTFRVTWLADPATGEATAIGGVKPGTPIAGRSAQRFDGGVFLGVDDDVHGVEPGTWDGVALAPLVDLYPGSSGRVDALGRAGRDAIFASSSPDVGYAVFATDGTPEGTRLVVDIAPGPTGVSIGYGRQLGDRVLFPGWPFGGSPELWVTDGTTGGTLALGPYDAPWDSEKVLGKSRIQAAELPGGRLVLTLGDAATGGEPWVTDGTPAGTSLLADLWPGPASSLPWHYASAGSLVVFAATDPVLGDELFVTDGTPAGTRLLVDLAPGAPGSAPRELAELPSGGEVVFAAWTPGAGREPWVTDGTAAGTRPLTELRPGPESSSPEEFTPAGDSVLFAASGGPEGRELWAFDLATAPERGNCADALDNDADGDVDCDDDDCASSDPCLPLDDPDGDGVGTDEDCAPADAGSFRLPVEPTLSLTVSAGGVPTLAWDDLASAAGPDTTYAVAGGSIGELGTGPAEPCLASGLAATRWDDALAPAERWYLVRGTNACGPAAGEGWGEDSTGAARAGCP